MPFDVVRIAIPLLLYFGHHVCRVFRAESACGVPLSTQCATLSFKAASNNFELAIQRDRPAVAFALLFARRI
jgi:ACR3 family arsenite efflux pump ArsB